MVGYVLATPNSGLLDEGICVKAYCDDACTMDLQVHYKTLSHQRNQSYGYPGGSDEGDREAA